MGSIIRAPIKLISKAVETVSDIPKTILGGITGGGSDPAPAPAPKPEEEVEVSLLDTPSTSRRRSSPRVKRAGGAGDVLGGYGVIERDPSKKSIMSR